MYRRCSVQPWRCSAPKLRQGCVFLKCHVGRLSICRCKCDPWWWWWWCHCQIQHICQRGWWICVIPYDGEDYDEFRCFPSWKKLRISIGTLDDEWSNLQDVPRIPGSSISHAVPHVNWPFGDSRGIPSFKTKPYLSSLSIHPVHPSPLFQGTPMGRVPKSHCRSPLCCPAVKLMMA